MPVRSFNRAARRGAAILLALLAIFWARPCHAQATIELVSPPSVQPGTTTRITVAGAELSQVLGLWSSLPQEMLRAKPVDCATGSLAQFDVALAPNAPLGIYGLRVATASGLSNVHLFLVDDLPAVATTRLPEIDGARQIRLPAAVWGTFHAAQIERFAIEVRAGECVTFETIAGRLGKDADPLIRIFDSDRRLVVESDNDVGLMFDSRFEHTFASAGSYTVELSDTRFHGADNWGFLLRMGHFPAARVALPSSLRAGESAAVTLPELPGFSPTLTAPVGHYGTAFFQAIRRPADDASAWLPVTLRDYFNAVEVEPNDQPDQAVTLTVPCSAHGCLAQRGDRDWYVCELTKGQKLEIRAETRAIGSAADLELVLVGPKGNEIKRIDDVLLDEAGFSFVAPTDGPHRLLVREVTGDGGPAFTYRIEVRPGGAQFQLASAVSDVTVPQDGYQTLPINVTRTEYQGPIALSLSGAPQGVSLEPDILAEGASEQFCSLRVPKSVPIGLYTLQIIGRAQADEKNLMAVAKTQPLVDRQLLNVDLIKHALRENQRFLPPSLTETIALQVTPPAPFTFELVESPITLARYQSAEIPIATTRSAELTEPIVFAARGGPIGSKSQLRVHVYTEIPNATREQPNVTGQISARNLAQSAKSRVDIDATAVFQGHKITLSRAFQLDLRSAFEVSLEQPQLTLEPGQTANIRLNVQRLKTFAGAVSVGPTPVSGLELPETIVIPADQSSAEFELRIPSDKKPGRINIRLPAKGQVAAFQEEIAGPTLAVDVKAPPNKMPPNMAPPDKALPKK